MGLEIELKFRIDDPEPITRNLAGLGAIPSDPIEQSDLYLAHPSRDFAVSGEAFRIRREGEVNRLTYKGPKLGGPAKTREEIEIETAAGTEARSDLRRMFEALGFTAVAEVRKTRTPHAAEFEGVPLQVALDRTADSGSFVEIEAYANDPADRPQCEAAVRGFAEALGLDSDRIEPRSYLRMFLESRGRPAPNPT